MTQRRPSVLLVDDVEANLVALEAQLGHLKCELVRASTGNDALRELLKRPFAVMLLDVQMPEMNGYEVAKYARENPATRDVPIIFVTATHETEETLIAGYGAGAVDFLFKPVNPYVLRSKVQVFLDLYLGREALHESRERFRQIADTIDEVLWLADPAIETMLYISPAYEVVWGRSCQSLYEKPRSWLEAIHADDREAVRQATLKKEATFSITYRILRPNGTTRWIHDRGFAVRDSSGRVNRYVGIAKDITDIRLAEEALRTREAQLRHSQKMEAVGRLAGGVAHNFNNLLTVITGHGELLLSRECDSDATRSHAKDILEASQRAAALTRQLLALGEKQLLQPKVVDLNDVILDTMRLLESVVGADVKLVMTLAPALGSVKVDRTQVCQVIAHLAINAREAMSSSGTLTVETANVELDEQYGRTHAGAQAGSYVMLAMTDTGCGMDGEHMSHMFEAFFTTKPVGKGTGLGLATVHGIVKQSGGHVSVESEPAEGTTFRIYLPRVEETPSDTFVAPSKEEVRGGTETILLVDDEDSVRLIINELLSDSGYQVLEATSGREALEISEDHKGRIDLLLTDVMMPEMNGRVLAEHLTRARPETKVLYLSGYTNDALIEQGLLDAHVALLQKPFALSAFLRTIRELLENEVLHPSV